MLSPSVLLPIVYLSLPVAAIGFAAIRFRHSKNPSPLRELLVTFVLGTLGGLTVAAYYIHPSNPPSTELKSLLRHSTLPISEIAIACYWGIAVACILRVVNAILKFGVALVLPARTRTRPYSRWRDVSGSIVRASLLFAFAIPYVGAMALVWRPHIVSEGTPRSVLGKDYQDVSFVTSDGLTIRGWWIPGFAQASESDPQAGPIPSERTIILCHGFNSDKAADLRLVRDLAPADFNILAFDFRGHGQSDGQLCTFGDLERRDVLAAVKFAREKHPNGSRKIFGLGVGLGSAALIAAAADTNDGQFIDAVAVFAPYDRVSNLIQDQANNHYAPTVGWVAVHASLQIAGAQLGTKLARFSPEDYVDQIAPRPLLVIAAEQDKLTDVSESQSLFEKASQPKYSYWVKGPAPGPTPGTKKLDARDIMLFRNRRVSRAVRFFFETARSVL